MASYTMESLPSQSHQPITSSELVISELRKAATSLDALPQALQLFQQYFETETPPLNSLVLEPFFSVFSLGTLRHKQAVVKVFPRLGKVFMGLTYQEQRDLLEHCFDPILRTQFYADNRPRSYEDIKLLGHFARSLSDDYKAVLEVVLIIIKICWRSDPSFSDYASMIVGHMLQAIAKTPEQYFSENKGLLYARIASDLLPESARRPQSFCRSIRTIISSDGTQRVIHLDFWGVIVPHLLLTTTAEKTKELVQEIAKFCNDTNLAVMILENLLTICKELYKQDWETFCRTMETVAEMANTSILGLLGSLDGILLYFLQSFRREATKTLRAVSACAMARLDVPPPEEVAATMQINSKADLIQYLVTNNDVIAYVVSIFSMIQEPFESIRDALESFVDLLKLLPGDQIASLEWLTFCILNAYSERLCGHDQPASISESPEAELFYELFKTFLRKLNIELVKSRLPALCKTFISLMKLNARRTAQLYKILILDQATSLKGHLHTLYVPNHELLVDVKKAISADRGKRSQGLAAQLQEISAMINNTTDFEVKSMHMMFLRMYLERDGENFRRNVPQMFQPCVKETFEHLLMNLTTLSKGVNREVAGAVGTFGALDPGRFGEAPLYSKSQDLYKNHPYDYDGTLVCKIINRIAEMVECKVDGALFLQAQYVIQRILMLVNIQKHDNHWTRLTREAQNACSFLFASRLSTSTAALEPPTETIFTRDKQFSDWICEWATSLAGLIQEPSWKELFSVCNVLFEEDHSFAQMLLPTLVKAVLSDRNVDDQLKQRFVIGEVKTIMKSAIPESSCDAATLANSMLDTKSGVSGASLVTVQHACAQIIFSLMDSLREHNSTAQCKSVATFISEIDLYSLARLAFGCQAYSRALMYISLACSEYCGNNASTKNTKLLDNLHNLQQQVFVATDEPDGVDGIAAVRTSSASLMDDMLLMESKGQSFEALSCSETLLRAQPYNLSYQITRLRLLLNSGQYFTVLSSARGLSANPEKTQWEGKLKPYLYDAMVKLSQWDYLEANEIDDLKENTVNMQLAIASLVVEMRKFKHFKISNPTSEYNLDKFSNTLDLIRQKEVSPIAAAIMEKGAYERCYPHIIRLHMLMDLENASIALFKQPTIEEKARDPKTLFENWTFRNSSVQYSLATLEPILSLQRVLIDSSGNNNHEYLVKSWLESAKLARKNGNRSSGYNSVLQARRIIQEEEPSNFSPGVISDMLVECAKNRCGDKDYREAALVEFARNIKNSFSNFETSPLAQRGSHNEDTTLCDAYTKVKLRYLRFAEETSKMDSHELRAGYEAIVSLNKCNSKNLFYYAKYLNKWKTDNMTFRDRAEIYSTVCVSFGRSLINGYKYLYESLPELLSTWLKFAKEAQDAARIGTNESNEFVKLFEQLNGKVKKLLTGDLPSYIVLTAAAQIMSRILHPNLQARHLITLVIIRLLRKHPRQAMWHIIGIWKSKNVDRSKTMADIIGKAKTVAGPELGELTSEMEQFESALSREIFDTTSKRDGFRMLNKDSKLLYVLDKSKHIALPLRTMMTVSVPKTRNDAHLAFPEDDGYLVSHLRAQYFEMTSAARPKKLSFVCKNGKTYDFLAKPKDDLRKDCRVIEIFETLNRLLIRDPETRKRRLQIRTFSAVALTSESGLIEWIDGLTPILGQMRQKYQTCKNRVQLSDVHCDFQALTDSSQRGQAFTRVVKNLQPVFGEWFREKFPDPSTWFLAQLSFTRSCAVMSMAGFLLGLGDRHLDNILLDMKTGGVVHVDFDCIFNKGVELPVPERVPFRLTHNMVDAFGLTGIEGFFRRSCEETMRVMRLNPDALTSVLRPFVYDPHLQWFDNPVGDKRPNARNPNERVEVENSRALLALYKIEKRLQGVTEKIERQNPRHKHPEVQQGEILSVAAQVDKLIQEATCPENLSRMYVGWAPYL